MHFINPLSILLLIGSTSAASVVGIAYGFAQGVTPTGTTVTPTNNAQLSSYLAGSTPRVIVLTKTFDFAMSTTTTAAYRATNKCSGGQDTIKGSCDSNEMPIVATYTHRLWHFGCHQRRGAYCGGVTVAQVSPSLTAVAGRLISLKVPSTLEAFDVTRIFCVVKCVLYNNRIVTDSAKMRRPYDVPLKWSEEPGLYRYTAEKILDCLSTFKVSSRPLLAPDTSCEFADTYLGRSNYVELNLYK
ncbi:hypothetical protein F5Y12DRAFT_779686 [Xylaria sp. FL1777]|nr:hypothetical protein F5Y12DRAFT_779686 [Xylaria sp. FL1777]